MNENTNKRITDLYTKIELLEHYVFELENRIKELEKNNNSITNITIG